ncbi:MAG TPA: hypothetical protein P5081_11040 [Phycisphaerae bacterium]|nr:hypothetical protein [Phycisphaerae bacterium]HRW53415.1 hypothetical protein [Phycisphaerae bacterium]
MTAQMVNQSTTGRGILGVVVGFVGMVAATIGLDALFHATGVYPDWRLPMESYQWGLALVYRVLFGVGGGYVASRVARGCSFRASLFVGLLSALLSACVVAMHWNMGPEFGPRWFNLLWLGTTIPSAMVGGRLAASRARSRANGPA